MTYSAVLLIPNFFSAREDLVTCHSERSEESAFPIDSQADAPLSMTSVWLRPPGRAAYISKGFVRRQVLAVVNCNGPGSKQWWWNGAAGWSIVAQAVRKNRKPKVSAPACAIHRAGRSHSLLL